MKTIEYQRNPLIDRSGWPAGEWDNEPDKIQWQDEATGYPCLIVRNRMGGLCGYVGVPNGHRFYGVEYDDDDVEEYPPVHGGLTFSDRCADGPEDQAICHVVEDGESDDVWWLGFDCGHWMDVMPRMLMLDDRLGLDLPEATYKNVAYVKNECKELAQWLKQQTP